ncbi:hypothetical protein KIM67_10800 [Flagellimonas sp. 389]|uniref:hypothetical protein n=1 Tax=Flagellimonas sp. 389 TaxID=2835862 RepID=UPI001BD5AA72|nr:hypothetical protein [Flagellimonas sp. 389]MBS9462902.1 hypothetical protein [Flagellimonas sp. 389]
MPVNTIIKNVAKILDLSPATTSKALNDSSAIGLKAKKEYKKLLAAPYYEKSN